MRELMLALAVVYTVLVLGAGGFFARRVRTFSDYLVAGRTLPLSIVLGTTWATYVGGATIVGWTGAFYTFGLDWWFYGIGAIAGVTTITLVWSRRVRRLGVATLPELIERRYDARARIALALAMAIAYLAIYVVRIMALGPVLMVLAGLPAVDRSLHLHSHPERTKGCGAYGRCAGHADGPRHILLGARSR